MRPTQVVGGGCFGLLSLLALAALTGLFLPRTIDYVASREVAATPTQLYEIFTTADGVLGWWDAVEAVPGGELWPDTTQRHLDGPESGAGMKIAFALGEEDIKFWTILAAEEDRWVTYDVDFKVMNATRRLDIEPAGEGRSLVRLTETPDIGNPVMRWMARLPGEDIEQSFLILLEAAEQAASTMEASAGEEPSSEASAVTTEAGESAEETAPESHSTPAVDPGP